MDKQKVVVITDEARKAMFDFYDDCQRIMRRRNHEVVGFYFSEADDREILSELQESLENPYFCEALEAHLLWRAELEFLCGGRYEPLSPFDELCRSIFELAMAYNDPSTAQPCIRWPQRAAPRKLGPKPTTASTAACRRKPRSSFFSASKTNLRNAP